MGKGYSYDNEKAKFYKLRTPVKKRIRRFFLLFVASLCLTVVYYIIFALFFSTETERRLERENEMYRRELPHLLEKEALLVDVIEGLDGRDDHIYEEIFHTTAPSMNPANAVKDFSGVDTLPDHELVSFGQSKLGELSARADAVEADFMRIAELLKDKSLVMPPMDHPLGEFTFAQTGASVGNKVNPFYKVPVRHNGLDIVAHSGEPIYVTADGVVADVIRERKGLGNVVVVKHAGGYVTRYAHLAEIEVRKGRKVKKGQRIGYVGISGNSYAPHLHYEVLRDTLVMDPVNHFFASLDPDEYVNVLIMAATTGQSLD